MNNVPVMISTKDLDYIKDMFGWNFTTSKVAYDFSEIATMDEVKQILLKVATIHKENCIKLLNILG